MSIEQSKRKKATWKTAKLTERSGTNRLMAVHQDKTYTLDRILYN